MTPIWWTSRTRQRGCQWTRMKARIVRSLSRRPVKSHSLAASEEPIKNKFHHWRRSGSFTTIRWCLRWSLSMMRMWCSLHFHIHTLMLRFSVTYWGQRSRSSQHRVIKYNSLIAEYFKKSNNSQNLLNTNLIGNRRSLWSRYPRHRPTELQLPSSQRQKTWSKTRILHQLSHQLCLKSLRMDHYRYLEFSLRTRTS